MKKFLVALLFYFNTMAGSEWYAGVRMLTAVDFGVFSYRGDNGFHLQIFL
jgi:hypothetical protein